MTTPRHLPPLSDEERAAILERLEVADRMTAAEAEATLADLEAEAAAATPPPEAGTPLA